jgi:hypothetical protein
VAVTGQHQLRAQAVHGEFLALLEEEGIGGQERRRREAHQRRAGRDDHHVEFALLDAVQRGQAFRDQVMVRREGVVGQRLPVREQRAAQVRIEPGHFVLKALRIHGAGADDGNRVACGLCSSRHARQGQRIAGTRHAEFARRSCVGLRRGGRGLILVCVVGNDGGCLHDARDE